MLSPTGRGVIAASWVVMLLVAQLDDEHGDFSVPGLYSWHHFPPRRSEQWRSRMSDPLFASWHESDYA